MKPFYLNTALKHTAAWLVWFGLNSIIIFGSTEPLNGIYWFKIAVNFSSLVLVYYAVFFVMRGMYRRFDYEKYDSLGLLGRAAYMLKAELLAVLALAALYIIFSVWFDREMGYGYPNLLSHFDKRFTRLLPYVIVAGINSKYAVYQRGQKELARANELRYQQLQRDMHQIKELYRTLSLTESRN
jgi:hypothetical protein